MDKFAASETARITTLGRPAKLVVITACAAGLLYFPWRLSTFNPHALILSALLYAAELFGLVAIALHTFMTWRLLERQAPAPGEDATVDVFIPTYNEPVEMLRRTLLAARNMKHPHETWLLDDGNRPAMARLAAELGVRYLARSDNRHAKAGNLNNGLKHARGQFIAIFDADHVPHEDYLVKTLGYFRDSKVAFVQTPQDFYNLDSFQHRKSAEKRIVWTEQSLFFRVIMPGKDYWNAAFFCGSCATARRSAIEDIGGFAVETVTEDLHTSIRLHKKGYSSVYHAESLAFGIAPDTFEPYESQRVRWGQGAMQVWRKEGMLTARGLSWPQRFCYLASVLTYFDGWQKAFMYLLPSFVLLTGILPIANLNWQFAAYFLPWWLLSLWACEELGRGYARSWIIEQYNFLRYPGFAFATLTFFVNRRLRFKVTRKGGSQASDNLQRMAPHIAIIAIALAAALSGAARYAIHPYMQLNAFILNLVWAGVVTTTAIVATLFALGRSKQERASYRFHLPVPVVIRWPGQAPKISATEDISSNGFRLVQQDAVSPGAEGQAELILPSGRNPVAVRAARVWPAEGGVNAAFNFVWPSPDHADILDQYLYGSNGEWLLNGIQERTPTPVDRIGSFLSSKDGRILLAEKNWQAVVVLPEDFSRSETGLMHYNKSMSEPLLALPQPLASDQVALIVAGKTAQVRTYRVTHVSAQEFNRSRIYLHTLRPRAPETKDFAKWAQPAYGQAAGKLAV